MSEPMEQSNPLALLKMHAGQHLADIKAATETREVNEIEAFSRGFITAVGELGLVSVDDIEHQKSDLALEACFRRNRLNSNELYRIEFADQAFLRAIEEINSDIGKGTIPKWIGDFDDLIHFIGHRDRYGGLYDEDVQAKGLAIFGDEFGYKELLATHRTRIHFWLRNRPGAIPGARFRDDFSKMLNATS